MEDEDLTYEEMEALESAMGYPKQEEKQNIFTFFKRVIGMQDTSRTANLTEVELGGIRIPVRTLQKLSLYCKTMGLVGLAHYFQNEAMVITHTSLSREGFLDQLAVTQKREMAAHTKSPPTEKQKRTWFKKKNRLQEQQ